MAEEHSGEPCSIGSDGVRGKPLGTRLCKFASENVDLSKQLGSRQGRVDQVANLLSHCSFRGPGRMSKQPMLSGTQLRKIPRQRHHHWPSSVSEFWVDADGKVSRLECNGALERRTPLNTALISDGHRVKLSGPWDATIEPLFQEPDDNFKYVINELLELRPPVVPLKSNLNERLFGRPIPDDLRQRLGECLASLIVRSPAFREQLWQGTAYTRNRFGFQADISRIEKTNLTVLNMNQRYGGIKDSLTFGGKLVLLFSDGAEFIFGDGFLHNITGSFGSGLKCLVPLTPSMCVAYCAPITYRAKPNLVAISVHPEEVQLCNHITQVYTKDYVYFRSQQPVISTEFAKREFLLFESHRHKWLDWLLAGAAAFSSNV